MYTRGDYIRIVKQQPYKVGHLVGFDKLSKLHNQWMVGMLYGKDDITLLAHRLSYKTTCVSVVLAILVAFHPTKSTLFMRKTDRDTVEIIGQVKKILSNEKFLCLVQAVMGKTLVITKATSTELDTNFNASPRGTSQLLGIGTSGSLTGKHYDYIFTDDIVNLQDRLSQAERQRVKSVYNELQNIRTHGGRIINTGTPWHREDAIATLMPNVQRFDCYSTGIMPDKLIEQKRNSMPPSLFAANYQLVHIAAEDALFKTAPLYFNAAQKLRDGIAHIDASYGGQDFTAFTCASYDQENDCIYAYGRLWHKHVDQVIQVVIAEANDKMCAPIYCEDNGDKGYLKKQFSRYGVYARSYSQKQNKVLKISSYLRKWWGRIYWLQGTDKQYLNQILDYTENAQHDDAPDSAACICRLLDRHSNAYVMD